MSACGPSAKERVELQRLRDDSLKTAVENATKQKLAAISAMKDSIQSLQTKHEGYKNRLATLTVELEVARDKMNSIKQVQLLRTPEEREQQIREQSKTILKLETEISELPNRIRNLSNQIDRLSFSIKDLEK